MIVGSVLSRYISALTLVFAAKAFHALSVIAAALHTYIFQAPVSHDNVTVAVPFAAHADTVMVVVFVMFAHDTALVHHQYLIVYVHAVSHQTVSVMVIVADLL